MEWKKRVNKKGTFSFFFIFFKFNIQKVLTESNYEATISLTCHEISSRMEKVVMKSTFNRV